MTTYYYKVSWHLTTFTPGESYGEGKSFTSEDLLESRKEAIEYYNELMESIKHKRTFFGKDFVAPKDFDPGVSAASSVSLELIECENDEDIMSFVIAGEDEDEVKKGRETERLVFQSLGINLTRIDLDREI